MPRCNPLALVLIIAAGCGSAVNRDFQPGDHAIVSAANGAQIQKSDSHLIYQTLATGTKLTIARDPGVAADVDGQHDIEANVDTGPHQGASVTIHRQDVSPL